MPLPQDHMDLPDRTVTITRETLVRYAGASGDFNPIHYSEYHATALGLPGVVAHGMLTLGLALRIVTDFVTDPADVLSWYAKFAKPVPVPDDTGGAELRLSGTLTACGEPDEAGDRIATVAVEALCAGERVLRGATAQVRLRAALTRTWRWSA